MKLFMLVTGLALIPLASAASAKTLNYNLPNTNACFEAASVKDSTGRGLWQCSNAIMQETTTSGDDRMANLVNRGILQLLANRNPAAGTDFDQALMIDPTQAEAWLGKAIQAFHEGNGAQAVALADRSLQYGPRRPAVAYLIRGLGNEQQGQLRAAYTDLQLAHQLDPRWSEPMQQLTRYRIVRR